MPFLRLRAPLSLLDIHHLLVVLGSLMTLPHFISCQDYSTPAGLTGLLLSFILLIENISGFYGRYLHAKVEKLRREISSPYLKEALKNSEDGGSSTSLGLWSCTLFLCSMLSLWINFQFLFFLKMAF